MMITGCLTAMLCGGSPTDVLVYSRTEGFRHDSIERGVEVLQELAEDHGWALVQTEDESVVRRLLPEADVLVLLNTTQDVFGEAAESQVEQWLQAGGGLVGVHAAADTEYDWPFYGTLLGGAWFRQHPRVQQAAIVVEDPTHPVVSHVPSRWVRTDEWYDFRRSPRDAVHVVASLDESSYEGGVMGDDHPIVWTVPVGRGAALYTGLGHTSESWAEPAFRKHVAKAIDWAAADGWMRLEDLLPDFQPAAGWSSAGGATLQGRSLVPTDGAGVLTNAASGRAGDLVTASEFGDIELHLEFMVPEGGNSGVYLQGRYEVQILDSFGNASPGPGDCGGIYERWDETRTPKGFEGTPPTVNAARPAGTWQTYDIVFTAPRFGPDGSKVANARLDRVTHNGVVIHEDVELTGPTRGGGEAESPRGPIRLQGAHGPVAYRNMRVRRLRAVTPGTGPTTRSR